MPPRRPSPPAEGSPPAAQGQDVLQRKYSELLARHASLVEKQQLRQAEHFSTHQLSTWAMETSASALALLSDGVVLLANRRWHELDRSGPWYRLHQGRPREPALPTLRLVAAAAAQALSASQDGGPLVDRYQEQTGPRTLEVRTERVRRPGEPRPRWAVLVLAHDITARIQAEQQLEQARAALTQQEHLRALGELASGVAHDLNNTLNAMKLRLDMLERDAAFAARQRPHLDALVRIVTDASTRVRHLQDFAQQRPEPSGERLQLPDVIHEAVEIARSDLEHRASREGLPLRIDVKLPPLPPVSGAATDLRYVFINLLLNARDAMPRGGTIRVRGARKGNAVIITVEDEGTGIPPAHLHSIFRPFFTTKGSQGTGLGLSMAYGVMSRLGGSITAANRAEGGAVFTLCFPLAGQAAEPPRAPPPPRPKRRAPRPRGKRP